ncbi:MAG TPA: DUF4350 domain-containing protein [Thermoanaerobaculaceae bacterium]|mgnify:CR=1 FL=1|nr:DUF4350 domain-containing protein [Thermoanaerobaculaceae bacterium]HRS15150.1 DUF4350 domain-containing protein [Thermoanaerobaculaceae bacterium]
MRRARAWLVVGVLVAAGVAAVAILASAPAREGASALSRRPMGLWTARRYLEARGARLELRDAPLGVRRPGGTLVLAFPASVPVAAEERVALRRHLAQGGAVVLAYSGLAAGSAEAAAAEELGVEFMEVRSNPHLWPPSWWRFERAEWRLQVGEGEVARPIAMRAPKVMPVRAGQRTVFLRGPDGEEVGFEFALRRGRVVVLPAEILANCRIGQPGAVDLLEGLTAALPGRWELDEWRHGLRPPAGARPWRGSLAFDLLLVQLALVYGMAVWMLGRPLGTPWRDGAVAQGSVASFLVSLGRLHKRLRHHREAGLAMVQRATELDEETGRRLASERAGAAGGAELLALAARVAAAQRWRGEKGRHDG